MQEVGNAFSHWNMSKGLNFPQTHTDTHTQCATLHALAVCILSWRVTQNTPPHNCPHNARRYVHMVLQLIVGYQLTHTRLQAPPIPHSHTIVDMYSREFLGRGKNLQSYIFRFYCTCNAHQHLLTKYGNDVEASSAQFQIYNHDRSSPSPMVPNQHGCVCACVQLCVGVCACVYPCVPYCFQTVNEHPGMKLKMRRHQGDHYWTHRIAKWVNKLYQQWKQLQMGAG